LVRDYVKEKVGEQILNKVYGVYDNVKELEKDWENLPDRFVLKATHGCGWNYICKDKSKASFKEIKTLFKHWLKSNFYYAQRELIYKDLTPRIIAEQYLEDESGELMDYKFHCFKGEPKFINVIVNRFSNMKLNTYDMNWNFIDVSFDNHYPNDPDWEVKKPPLFEKMIYLSRKLSEDFNYVRVDFYLVNGNIYFGELTFTPGNGAYTSFTEEDDLYFGSFFNQ
ncbi:MAG: ATP-grasp fold amidoligase family protein, partial [bacterium]